jgi:aminopeptidase N
MTCVRLLVVAGLLALLPAAAPAQYREDPDTQSKPLLAEDYSDDLVVQKEPVEVQHYVLDAELKPASHELQARAQIRIIARQSVTRVSFELNGNLFPKRITDDQGRELSSRRVGDGLKLDVTLPRALSKDQTTTINIEYEGALVDAENSPVEGVQLAYIGEETSYLFYPARWFPVLGYTTNRYTAELHFTVPQEYQVVSGGRPGNAGAAAAGTRKFAFVFDKPTFAGSIGVVREQPQIATANGIRAKVYFTGDSRVHAAAYGETAAKMVGFFTSKFGPPPVADISIVEIGDASLGGYAAPEVIFLSSRAISSEVNLRLLAQEVSQQWWRGLVSPATRADLWLDHGLATYSEALYLESLGGKQVIEDRIREMSVEALTHDTIPIRAAGRLREYSPEYKSLLYDKPGYVMHMLRWVVGDEKFFAGLKKITNTYAFQPLSTDGFKNVMEEVSGEKLDGFFMQWFSSTGASDFKLDYTVYRLKDGYRISGTVSQDQDLFSMPVEVQIQTANDPITTRVEVTGKSSEFTINSPVRPINVVIDPNNRVLKYNNNIRERVAIARGEQAVAQRDYPQALEEYQKALDINKTSSLAQYRVGEVFYQLRNYQSAANAFRAALNGNLDPAWTEVWSHLSLGKIFDITGQRDRAVNEYQQAIRTKDNTQGAIDLANQYLKTPFERGSQTEASN